MNKVKYNVILILLIIVNTSYYAQFESQEHIKEAKDIAAICNSFTFLDLYDSDATIIPDGYKKTFSSGVFGMDNKYQIYQTKTKAVINLRGSTAKTISWMENFYSTMIPAKGKILIQGDAFDYQFVSDTSAGIHAGYVLGIAFLAKDIVFHIKSLNNNGIYDIILAGHSQGGALAILLRAYLEYLPQDEISSKNSFKTYAFAHPKVGNKEFVTSYIKDCKKGTHYSIINIKDYIPMMPFSSSSHKEMSRAESFTKLLFNKNTSIKDFAAGTLENIFEGSISGIIEHTSQKAFYNISREVGEVIMPKAINDINYEKMENKIELTGFDYPKILKDSTVLENDSLMTYYLRDDNGFFIDQSLYKKEPALFQHKTYNYYVAFLKKFYPEEYDNLKVKILPDNL